MKLYHHFKKKPYRFVGVAKHSETLEDIVIYEALYENPLGKLWVRPKEMFFEKVGPEATPRFRPVPLEIRSATPVGPSEVALVGELSHRIFGEWDEEKFRASLGAKEKPFLLLASVEGKIVGFKLGYEKSPEIFYSWMGGVLPESRGLGIATALMNAQNEWCRAKGFRRVQTKTQNRFREMLILNIRRGFDVIETITEPDGERKILLEKVL